MGKDKSDKKDKKAEKEKKVTADKVNKKDKKEKKDKVSNIPDVADKLLAELSSKAEDATPAPMVAAGSDSPPSNKSTENIVVPVITASSAEAILVPFATPLANEKVTKKALKAVKKGAKSKALKRGVKEVVKAIRKSSTTSSSTSSPSALVILAADISPMDVIAHIPVLCEDHNIPYVFVSSRAELGAAGGTKRPTSVVMVVPALAGRKKKGDKEGKDDEGLKEAYEDLAKAVAGLQ